MKLPRQKDIEELKRKVAEEKGVPVERVLLGRYPDDEDYAILSSNYYIATQPGHVTLGKGRQRRTYTHVANNLNREDWVLYF